jgi:amidase
MPLNTMLIGTVSPSRTVVLVTVSGAVISVAIGGTFTRMTCGYPRRSASSGGEGRPMIPSTDDPHAAWACRAYPEHGTGPLADLTFGVKDIIDVRGLPTAYGLGLDAPAAAIDAWCVAILRAAGAACVGKTTTTPLAWRDPAPTRNPHAEGRTPGGSSAGSAAAVAAGEVPFALGTQTVGSTLRPAAYCGIVGFKPTYGTIPAFGVSPLAPSVDHVGIIARDVALVRRVARVYGIAETAQTHPPRLGFAPGAFADRIGPKVEAALRGAAESASRGGAQVDEITLPPAYTELFPRLERLVAFEAFAVLRPWSSYALPPHVRALLDAGERLGYDVREDALAFREATRESIETALAPFDVVILAVADVAPGTESTGDGVPQGAATFYGLPALALPIGRVDGLPVAAQLIARRGEDAALLVAAQWLERTLASGGR